MLLADGLCLSYLQPLGGAGRQTDGAPTLAGFGFTDLQLALLGAAPRGLSFALIFFLRITLDVMQRCLTIFSATEPLGTSPLKLTILEGAF
jgi:hypothetical protein